MHRSRVGSMEILLFFIKSFLKIVSIKMLGYLYCSVFNFSCTYLTLALTFNVKVRIKSHLLAMAKTKK